MKCKYCKEDIPAAGEGWPYKAGRHIWFCCAECKEGWYADKKEKKGKIDPKYPVYDDEEEDEIVIQPEKKPAAAETEAQEDEQAKETEQLRSELGKVHREMESLRMDYDIIKQICDEQTAEIAGLKEKKDALTRMVRDAMVLID